MDEHLILKLNYLGHLFQHIFITLITQNLSFISQLQYIIGF